MVMGQDKVRKEVLAKSSGGVELLLAVLESTADPTVIQNLVFIINELIQSKSSSSKRVTTLINRGATQVNKQSMGDDFKRKLNTAEGRELLQE